MRAGGISKTVFSPGSRPRPWTYHRWANSTIGLSSKPR